MHRPLLVYLLWPAVTAWAWWREFDAHEKVEHVVLAIGVIAILSILLW